MVKPIGQPPATAVSIGAARGPRLLAPDELADTKGRILDAAFRQLATEGYAALSIRRIAADAGVNHALINYHFRSKDQLVVAVLDEANRRLLARQTSMYQAPTTLAEKWAEARRFYRDDLASGFVRVQAELMAAGFASPELREKVVPRVLAWKEVVQGGVRQALDALAQSGVELPSYVTAEVIACWITDFWLGMELADLLGATEQQIQQQATLDAFQRLLEDVDARVRRASTQPTQRQPRSRRTRRSRS